MLRNRILLVIICLHLTPIFLFGIIPDNSKDSIRAIETYRSGTLLSNQGLYTEALDSFLVALELRKKIYGDENSRVANVYGALGATFKNLGITDVAIQNLLAAENIYIKEFGNNDQSIAGVYLNLGNIYRIKLNYSEALQYYIQSANIYLMQESINYERVASAYYSIAEIYFRMYEYQNAIEIIESNIKLADEDLKIYYYDLLGAIYQEVNNFDKANSNYLNAIEQAIKLYGENDIDVGVEYLNYSFFFITNGQFENAIANLNKAYSIIILTEPEKGENLADYYRILGEYYEELKIESKDVNSFKEIKNSNLNEAILNYKKALVALDFPTEIQKGITLEEINSISLIQSFDLLKFIADAFVKTALLYEDNSNNIYQSSISQALDYYNITSSLLQRAKKEITDDESKLQLAELEQETFIKIVQAAYRAYEFNPDIENLNIAFNNAEQLKSGSLFEKLSDDAAMSKSLIPDSLLQLEQKINYNITTQTEKRHTEISSESPDSLIIIRTDSIIFNLKRQRTELNDYLEQNFSGYYNLKYSDNSIKVREVQSKLKNNQVLIEYMLNENDSISELYTFVVSKNNLKFTKQVVNNIFLNDIENIFHFMSNPRYMFTKNEDSKAFCLSSYNLYQKLVAPHQNEIKDKKIIIIPDGKLSYISFDALINELPDTTKNISFNNLDYLIKTNCINYSYSANLLFNFEKDKRKAQNKVLAFAPEYNSDTIEIGHEKFPLNPLPGTQKEVELIASEINTFSYIGKDASELNFRKNSENYDILHLAMHAYINDSLPTLSQFAFTQNKNESIESDGLLSTADIYNLNLKARLAVLSACNTGSGKLRKGEGVISLARGFLYAGCPSIVMTLWEVEDNSGTKIMGSFYKHLKKGKNKDEALRQAKLDYLSEANSRLAHPHYWLGFVNVGDDSALYRSYDFYFFSLLFLTIAGIIAEQIIRIKKARKKRA